MPLSRFNARRKAGMPIELFEENSPAAVNTPQRHAWSSNGRYSFLLTAWTIQNYLKRVASDWFPLKAETYREFYIDPKRSEPVLVEGIVAFAWEGRVHCYEVDGDRQSQTIRSQDGVGKLIKTVQEEVKLRNPLRGKHVHLISDDGLKAQILAAPQASFDDLILDPRMKEDLYDNTIFQIEHVPTNNGIILHGEPGTGKSLACQAIIHEAIVKGISTCFLVGNTDFDALDQFLQDFLSPCILVLEDIDTFAEDRVNGRDRFFADFLQFMSGLTTREGRIVVIATTNHLALLDAAVKNRPLRFNRKYEFHHPSPSEIDRMLGLHFDLTQLGQDLRQLCYDRKFTGAHIAEVKRTALALSMKRGKALKEVFTDAVGIVTQQFSPTLDGVGFGTLAGKS